ncbi:hypothetical protein B479_10465 [Pseudomonas putida HB3267]|nr:hypothetical protein B479_10465 [Pseudomonas putida HB3267]
MNVAGLINLLIMLLLMNDLILDLQMVLWRKFQKLQIYDLELYYWRDPTRELEVATQVPSKQVRQ